MSVRFENGGDVGADDVMMAERTAVLATALRGLILRNGKTRIPHNLRHDIAVQIFVHGRIGKPITLPIHLLRRVCDRWKFLRSWDGFVRCAFEQGAEISYSIPAGWMRRMRRMRDVAPSQTALASGSNADRELWEEWYLTTSHPHPPDDQRHGWYQTRVL
jgi:hypothetical protein